MDKLVKFRKPEPYESSTSHGRIWESKCGRYRLRESNILGTTYTTYYAQVKEGCIWGIISTHRKRGTAKEAIESAERKRLRKSQV